jgi:hypothetical protein
MQAIGFHKYKDFWVLTSAEKVIGGGSLDAPPVRLIRHDDRSGLKKTIEEVFREPVRLVPQPDYNDPKFKVGIRAEAVGVKSWRAFVKHARCFNLEREGDKLTLEEWPKQGGSFGGPSLWRKDFPGDALDQLVDFLIAVTKSESAKRVPENNQKTRPR